MTLIDAALNRSRTVLSALVLLLITGTFAYITIPKESDPDIQIPIIYVSLSHSGISPEDAERLLVRPMEQELRAIEGVKEMSSQAYQGGASIVMEFFAEVDIDQAKDDVREKVDTAKAELPDATDEPEIFEVNLSLFPVIVVTLSGDVPERTLVRAARDLRDEIEGLSNVLEADIAGDREEVVEVLIDPMKVESYGLEAAEVINLISRSNTLIAAGAMDTGAGRFTMKVPGLFENVDDILSMPLKVYGDGAVRLRDVAEVRRTFKDPESFARVGGKPAVALQVSKRIGTNIIDTIDQVKAVVAEMRATWPAGIQVAFAQDKSSDIRTMLGDLQNNVLSAILLVMIVVIWALGLRTGLLVGLAIPGSFLTAMLVLYIAGMTVNIVVLFSLILSVGMLVDGAIVITEYADRKMIDGMPRKLAYPLASKRMAWPIIASTATTLAAFFPLVFWPDVVGEFMKFLPITVLVTLSASLVMALIFVPTLGAYIGKPGHSADAELHALSSGEHGGLDKLAGPTGLYIRMLRRMLSVSWLVVPAAGVALVAVWTVFIDQGKGFEFFPEVEPEQAVVQIRARGNLSYIEQDALVREVESRVLALNAAAKGRWFDTVYGRSGKGAGGDNAPEDVIGAIQLELGDWRGRPPAREIDRQILDATADLAGLQIEMRQAEAGPPTGKDIQIQLRSYYPELVEAEAARLFVGLQNIDGLRNFEDGRALPGIDWELQVDRAQALKFDADVATIGNAVKLVTNGITVSTYRPNDSTDEIDIIARYPEPYRNLEELDRIRVISNDGAVPISNFVTRKPEPKTGTLRRVDSRRVMTLKADVEEGILVDTKTTEVKAWLKTVQVDPRVQVSFKGQDEEQAKAGQFLMRAFGVALFIMTIILVTQFNSFYSTFLIMVAVVMSTAGVLLGLLITGQPFGIVMNGISVVALAGIVVNNNIVLIDTYDRLKHEYRDRREAILRTGAQRLRPVVLTTVTTILGLIPMVAQLNIDFFARSVSIGAPSTQWWVQLATAIAFGLGFATLLTLIFTPCALYLPVQIRRAMRTLTARRRPSEA